MKEILFFISHQPNPRFVKQINFFARKHKVTLVHFERTTLPDLDLSIEKNIIRHNLGYIPNASQPLKRIWIYLKTIRKIRKILSKTPFDSILVNNADIVLLYQLSNFSFFRKRNKATLAVEISDLREFIFFDNFTSKCIRALERYLHRNYVDKLIVTSKKFYSYHFEKFFKKDVFVLENKMLSVEQKNDPSIQKKKNNKTVIGIVGMILRKQEAIQLFETYKNHPEVAIHVHGKGRYQHIVEEYASTYANIIYFGPYNMFTDAQRIYNSLDIIYLVYDTDQVTKNNNLLLPNKLYECMYYKVPILCSKESYLEEVVTDLGIGISVNYKEPNALENAVNDMKEKMPSFEENFSKLDKSAYFGDADYEALELFLIE